MRWFVDFVYLLTGVLYLPIALYQACWQGKNRHGWLQRFGLVPRFDSQRPRIWIHAVSLGEMNAVTQLTADLRTMLPNSDIVFSSTTDTGYARGVKLFGRDWVFRFPLDFSLVVNLALKRINPTLIVLVEQEVWYNLTTLAHRRGIPVVVVNGRLTEKSAKRLAMLGPIVRSLFAKLSWVGAQDRVIADRFGNLGVREDCLDVTGSLKWDSATVTDGVEGTPELARALGLTASDKLWVCGSTGPGEERIILNAYTRLLHNGKSPSSDETQEGDSGRVVLAIVPRKPERFDDVARLIEQAGYTCVRRSNCLDTNAGTLPPKAVILGDTMGELRKFYCLAGVVFVGRTLVPMGGSDPMEVAALGKPMIVGPHTENFRLPIKAFDQAEALRKVSDAPSLAEMVAQLLADSTQAEKLGRLARQVVLEHQGATRRTVDALVGIVGEESAVVDEKASSAQAVTAR